MIEVVKEGISADLYAELINTRYTFTYESSNHNGDQIVLI